MEEERKIERKRKRFSARLKSSKGIICQETPGPNIVLCNVGQATGLEKESIYELIKDLNLDIYPPKYISEKSESHSFLVFTSTKAATIFYNSCNGKVRIEKEGPPIIMNFVENVPNIETTCQYENPPGLTIINDFINQEEEERFLSLFDMPEVPSNLKNRQVQHYGYEFRYGSNDVDLNSPLSEHIPEQCNVLWERLKGMGFDVGVPDQLTVNKYRPGQGIPSHVDKHSPFGDTILSLSLGSSVVMDWKHHSSKYVPVDVRPRSMMVMQGEARYDWQHGIQPRTWDPIIEIRSTETTQNTAINQNAQTTQKRIRVITRDTSQRQTRISLTFRWTRRGPCQCQYKTLCDRVVRESEIEDDVATNLEELHVHQVYEQIAGHFSTTRHKPWPRVVEFMSRVPAGDVVVDLGCGNGKNILTRNDIFQLAGERSAGLLSECKQHISVTGASASDCVRLDLLCPGLRHRAADVIICIAVVHHFSNKARRLQAISTIYDILRPNGQALITVWAKDQTKSNYLKKNQETAPSQEIISVGGLNLPVHENRTQFQHNDLLVPWKLRKKCDNKLSERSDCTLLRYYHVFEVGELDDLCREAGFTVEDSFYEEGNWCVVCRK